MTGRAGSKRRSKKDCVTSFTRPIAGTQVKGITSLELHVFILYIVYL